MDSDAPHDDAPAAPAPAPAPAPEAGGDAASAPPRLSLGKRIVMMAFITVFFLGLLEGAAQLYQKAYRGADVNYLAAGKRLYEPHALLGYVLDKGVTAHGPDLDVRVNRLGFRGPEFERIKPAGTFRVFCLGGSTTFGQRAPTDADTWPRKLEARLRARYPDRKIEVVNAGVPGYTTFHSLNNLQYRILDYQPDLIVVYHGTNDLRWAPRIGQQHDRSRLQRVWKRHRGLEEALENSMLYATIVNWSEHARATRPFTDEERAGLRDEIPGAEDGLEAFRDNLEGMVDACRREGVPLLLATFASPFPEGGPTPEHEERVLRWTTGYMLTYPGLVAGMERYNDTVRSVARAEGTLLAEVDRELTGRLELFVDHCHFTTEGTTEVARVVFETIEAAGALEAKD